MEMKENAKHKTWKMTSNSEPSLTNDTDISSLKKFTIPKIRKTTEKVYLSPCCTNTREYSFIHGTLKQCRLDVSCDLQFTWQFGDSKLIHNENLERHFTAKRSEMRESGRHGRELEENFCFLAVPQSDVVEIYKNGLSTKASTLKILGNPLLGIYMFRHVDVALNYAHSQSITVETIMIFKVLFGKVKKVQPSVDKNKVSLDPSPNFDCHMSRNTPSLKDTIELQACNSVVYFYEYDVFARPVGKPRQCLPYAVVTVRFIGQKTSTGQLMTSLRFPSTGFPKRLERACSLNNCTVAKRIGKGKDATVIFEHFRKPVDSFVQENCSCKALNSEISPSKSDTSNSYGNVQNGNNSVLKTYNRQTDKSLEIRDTSQEHAHDSSLSSMSSNNRESGTGDLLFSAAYLKSILSSVSAAFPSHRNTGSSTVITSKLIKDPRLMKREQSTGKQNNNIKDLSEILPSDKSLHHGNPEMNLSCVSPNSVFSSKVVPDDHATNTCLDAPSFNFSFDSSQFQTHNMGSKSCDYIAANEMPMTEQCKKQPSFSFPISLSNAVSEVENQNSQKVQNRSNIPVLTKQSSHPQNFYESVNACRKQSKSHISQESQSSTVFPLQNKGNVDEYIQNIGKMRPFIAPEDNSKHEESQNWWKETNNCTNETKIIPIDHCITLHQEYKEGGNLNSLGENCEKILNTQEFKMSESLLPTAKNKDELDHSTLELECNPTPNIECLSQKHHQHSLIDEESIQTHFALAQNLVELKLVQKSHNFNIMTNNSQEAKDIPSAKEQLIDSVISSSTIDISLDSSNCNITGDYVCVQRKNENDPMSLKNIKKGCNETSNIKQVQDHGLFYNAELNCDLHLNSKFKEQKDKENPNEAKEEYSASYPEYKIENLNGSEKENTAAETALLESEHSVTAIRQRHAQNDGGSVKHLASIIPEIAGSSMFVAENAAKQVVSTTVLTPSTNHEERQKYQFKETCSSESSDLGLIKYVSDCEHSMDKNKLEESFDPLVNENSVLQTFELGSEIEIEFEECNGANLFPQDTYTYGNAVHEELELYETLKSRIDWKGLFLSSNEEMETSGSFAKRKNTDQPHSTESNCVSFSSQSNRKELHNPVLLPDLQITITNVLKLGFSPTADSFEMKDNFYEHTTKSTEREGRKEGKDPGFDIYSQPSNENSGFLCGDKFDNSMQDLGLGRKSGISHSSNLGHKTLVNNTYEKPNSESFSTKPNDTVISGESKFSSTKSKPGFNDTRNKDMESRRSKRKLHKASRGQNISHKDLRQHETYQKRRQLTSCDSSEHFSFLSQGRIKTFSQSERHIKSVLDILSSEASLCKSKRLSRKLDRAVLHLKKAHRRVHTSLKLISRVGKKRKGPLPKAYAIICNNFWESCDLQGDGFMSERRYSKHFLSKRKYDKRGRKGFLGFDFNDSVAQGSKYRSSRTNRGRVTECLSSEILPSSVYGSLATFHVREFCDEEHHPESLAYASQNTHQLEYNSSTVKSAKSSALEHFVKTSESVPYPDEALTEKENQTNMKLSNGDVAEPEHSSAHDIKDITKANNSEANVVTYKSSSVSLNYLKENNKNTTCKADTDILVSILNSNVKHFLNVDIYKQDNFPVSVCKRKLESVFPIGKCTVPIENSTPSIFMGNIFIDPLNLIASRRYNIPQLSSVSVTAGEEDSLDASLGRHEIFAIDSLASSPTTSYYSQIYGGKDFLKTKQCSLGNCLPVDENEVSVTEPSDLDLISVIEESKNCEKIRVKKLSSNDSSALSEDSIKYSSKQSMAKSIEEEKVRKIEQAVHKNIIEESAVDIEYRSQKKKLPKEDSFDLKKKIIKSNLISNDSPSDCVYTPAVIGIKHKPILHAHPETSKVIALQKKPVSYMKEIKEKYCLANYTSHVAELSQILQRADEAASLQILEEETKICQHILPLFVEAFERKQECSLERILISRDLLVDQNLWNNCRLKLKPCAVDTLVELQMVMETIEFIKNKKRILEGEPTFRSLLWYDETLYSELLHRPRGFQLQSNFYPAFQGRLKYSALYELKNYHNQLVKYLAKVKKDSYYAFLKYKRQINECEAIMKNYSDCSDFCLSVPFTCGVNFGDSLGDLETLRKTTLNLINKYGDSPKVHSYPGKKDHLWIIIEVITSKVNFIKNNEEVSIKICLYGLEHICFDAAKNLAWKEKSHSFSKKHSQKNKTELLKLNECAFSKFQKIYNILSENLNNEPASSIGLEEDAVMAHRFNETLLSYPDICCISEILDQAKFADLKKLQSLTLKCTDHLEILKKYFEMLQEDNINNIFITEENVLDILNSNDHGAVILKPEAIEVYIEIVMLSETVHFLKNLKAKKLDNQRFRGMLWFDLSLLPELVHCQEVMASFSFKDNSADCFWKVIDSTISKLKKEMDVIYGYNEAVNCSYALHLFSRELEELLEIKRLLKESKYSISTYIDFVPYVASINYGNTVTELEHNYNQFSTLLKNIMSVPQKDLGKMAHIIKVMRTIEQMKIISAKGTKSSIHFILFQILCNRRNIFQLNIKDKINIHVTKPEEISCQPSMAMQAPSVSERIIKNVSKSSKKRPITVHKCEDPQEKENIAAVSSGKKQKITVKAVTKTNRQTTFKHSRTTGSHSKDENKIRSSSSDNLKKNSVSLEMVKRQSSIPDSLASLKNLQDTCTSKSESKIDLASTSDILGSLIDKQENLNSIKKINANVSVPETAGKDCPFATCDQKDINSIYLEDHNTLTQKLHKNPLGQTQELWPSNIKAGTDVSLVPNASVFSMPTSHSVRGVHTNLKVSDTDFEHEDNEILDLSIKDYVCTDSSEPVIIQDKIPVLQVSQLVKTELPEKYTKDRSNPNSTPFNSARSSAPVATHSVQYSLSEQDVEDPKLLTQNAGIYWNELPQSACTPIHNYSAHSFGTSYPHHAWCVYHYSSSNGSAITHTYQGMTMYEAQPTPPGMFTSVASSVQSSHSTVLYSEYFSYLAEQPEANVCIPGNGYFPSHTPNSYNFQQPVFSPFVSHQPLPQAAYPYPPNPGVLPQVPWTYAPWQQEPFPPRH